MADKFDGETGNAFGVPIFFKRKEAQEQVIVAGHFSSTFFARGPHLWRNVLNDFWLPIVKPIAARARVVSYGVSKPAIEGEEIDTNNGIRFPFESELVKLVKEALKGEIVLESIGKPDDGMRGHVEGQLNSGSRHTRTARAEKARLEAGVEGLVIQGGGGLESGQLFPQGRHQFSRQHIAAGFAGDEHE